MGGVFPNYHSCALLSAPAYVATGGTYVPTIEVHLTLNSMPLMGSVLSGVATVGPGRA